MLVNGVSGNLISIRDRGLLYGDGVFRTLRVSHGRPMHWPLHYQKLLNDCTALDIPCPDFDSLSAELGLLLSEHPDAVFKVIVTRGETARGYAPAPGAIATHIWDVTPLPVYPENRGIQGVTVRLCKLRLGHQPRTAGIKHLNRLENVLAAAEVSDVQEGILLDTDGHVIEGVRSNLFLLSGGRLVTPDLSRCGVAGVQRDRVIDYAAKTGIPAEVRDIELDELFGADELFLTNSVFGLWPVARLEGRCWADFCFSLQLRAALELG